MINMSNSLQMKQEDKFFSRLLSKESSLATPSSRRLYYAGRPGSVPFLRESEPGTPKMAPFRDDHHDRLRGASADHDDRLRGTPADHDDQYRDSLPPPPLTPPPSYFIKKIEKLDHHHDHYHDHPHHHHHHHHHHKRSRSSNLLSSIFPKRFNIGYHALMIKLKPGQFSSVSPSNNGSESSSMLDHHCFGSPTTAFRARSVSASASWFSSSSSTTSLDSRGEDEDEVGDHGSPNSTLCFFGCYRR